MFGNQPYLQTTRAQHIPSLPRTVRRNRASNRIAVLIERVVLEDGQGTTSKQVPGSKFKVPSSKLKATQGAGLIETSRFSGANQVVLLSTLNLEL